MSKSNSKSKKVFEISYDNNLDIYQKEFKNIPKLYFGTLLRLIIKILIFLIVFEILCRYSLIDAILLNINTIILLLIVYKLKNERYSSDFYFQLKKRNILMESITLEFYEDYLVKKSDNFQAKVYYSDLKKVKETETNIYLYNDIIVVNLIKDLCTSKDIDFIRHNCINNLKKCNIDGKLRMIEKVLPCMFILTIFSIYSSILFYMLETQKLQIKNIFKEMWIFWAWLPIPLTLLILSIIYEKKDGNVKNRKNIILGFISSIVMIVLGFLSFIKV
ncbi:MAG: hypothetical protein Q4E39_01590 [bacterium]|nr:hypothetical protein [bacterium]